MEWQWSFWAAALFAVGLTMGISLALGLISLPFREMHFAIATLSFAMLFVAVLNNWPVLGGSGGMIASYGIPRVPLFPLSLIDPRTYQGIFTVSLLAVLLLLAGQAVLMNTRAGRAFVAIREDETLARSLGIAVRRYKVLAFVLSSVPAAVGGVLYAPFLTFIYPKAFALPLLINVILFVAVGGVGSLAGPVLGAVIFGALPELLRLAGELRLAIYGAALILITLFTPGGLMGWLDAMLRRRDVRRRTAPVGRATSPGNDHLAPKRIDAGNG
jgi:branched-chain amino acid transport system permease protein